MLKLVDVNTPAAISGGIFPSLAPNQAALWRTGDNLVFGDGRAEKFPGFTVEGSSPTGNILAMSQAYAEGIRRVYFASQAYVYKDEYGVRSQLGSGFGGTGYWSLCPFGLHLLATNDYDVPQIWTNSGSMRAMANVRRSRFRLMKKWQNHVLGFYGQSVDWTSVSSEEDWVPTPENSAGDLFFRDLDSDVFAACELGQNFGIYSADSLMLMQYLGAPLYFGCPGARINGIGAVSDSSVVPVGNRNFGLCRKGFFVTDGISFTYIGTPAVNRQLRDRIDWDQSRTVFGVHYELKETVVWWFKNLSGHYEGLAFNYKNSAWAPLSFEVRAGNEQQVFDYPLVSVGADWGFLGTGNDAGASAMPASIQTFNLDCGDRDHFKRWDMLRVDIETPDLSKVQIRFGFTDQPDGTVTWGSWVTLAKENWIHYESVHMAFEIRSTASGAAWALGGFSIHGEVTGEL